MRDAGKRRIKKRKNSRNGLKRRANGFRRKNRLYDQRYPVGPEARRGRKVREVEQLQELEGKVRRRMQEVEMARMLSLLTFRRRQKRRGARGGEDRLAEVVEMLEEGVDRVKEKVKSEDPNLYHSLPVYRYSVHISVHIDISYQVVVTLLSSIAFFIFESSHRAFLL